MNRNNIWIHVGLAVVLITIAAVLGQIDRWKAALNVPNSESPRRVEKIVKLDKTDARSTPDVLVRFKPGVSLDRIREIAAANHDVLEDKIESVSGLSVIEDMDRADAQAVADQYAAMTDLVSYAEVDNQIKLDDPIQKQVLSDGVLREPSIAFPNDPQFEDQWALNNRGQNGGKERADIDALKAWATTKGSSYVVVALI